MKGLLFFMMALAFLNKFDILCLSLCFNEESALPSAYVGVCFSDSSLAVSYGEATKYTLDFSWSMTIDTLLFDHPFMNVLL